MHAGIGYVSTYPPRECGIASFTLDLSTAVQATQRRAEPFIVAMIRDDESPEDYKCPVRLTVRQENRQDYIEAAKVINEAPVSSVSLQHEFGIFGGRDGEFVCDFVEQLKKPLVVTLHTVLQEPSPNQRQIIRYLVSRSYRAVVMNPLAIEILESEYGLDSRRVSFIHHGAPAVAPVDQEAAKYRLGLTGRFVVCTFGLLNRGKGIEYALCALPEVIKDHPEVIYLVVGETHPNVRRAEGETYREELEQLAHSLGIRDHVVFVNRYLSQNELLEYLRACDVYLTPYLNPQQIVSGTLAYAVALGKVVVSTPYLYAKFLCGNGRGMLVEFRDSHSIAQALRSLVEQPELHRQMSEHAARFGRQMAWSKVGQRYSELFAAAAMQPSTMIA